MEIRCENCGKLLAVSEGETHIDGSICIRCPKCKWNNVVKGTLKSQVLTSS